MDSTVQRSLSHFSMIDWSFPKESSRTHIHNMCWYPSRYIPAIPAQLINALSNEGDTVLDPFNGSGTTVIEAMRQGRNAVGLDLNAVGCFISRTKSSLMSGTKIDLEALLALSEAINLKVSSSVNKSDLFHTQRDDLSKSLNNDIKIHKSYKELQQWYAEDTLEMMGDIYFNIESYDGIERDVLRVLFMSILMTASGYKGDMPYTYYADNVKPKKGKIVKNAYALFDSKLTRFINNHKDFELKQKSSNACWFVHEGDSKKVVSKIEEKVDLIVTSPPYVGVTDYISGFRLAHLWYDFFGDMKETKKSEIGARWRKGSRKSPDKYINDICNIFIEASKILKLGGYVAIVIGEAKKYQGQVIDRLVDDLTSNSDLVEVDVFSRDINKKFFKHPTGGVCQEKIIILQKR